MRRRPALLAVPALLLLLGAAARGEDPAPAEPKKGGEPREAPYKGPEIAWAKSWTEACEEAAERNMAVYLHSHGST